MKWASLFVLPFLICGGALATEIVNPSRSAARRHAAFMQYLGESEVPLDSLAWTEELLDDCRLDNHELGIVRLQNWEWLAKPYLRDLCGPLGELLAPQVPCESEIPPEWCGNCEEIARRMDLDGYFDEMGKALDASGNELTRFNILYLMMEILYWMPKNFVPSECEGAADRWFTASVARFLKEAHPGDVTIIEEHLRGLFKKLPDNITRELRAFAESNPEMSGEREGSPPDESGALHP